jgi:hypothetical protein
VGSVRELISATDVEQSEEALIADFYERKRQSLVFI